MFPSLPALAKAAYTSKPTAALAGRTFKRAQKGLFNGKSKMFGNNVPESHQKTRRTWLPNIQQKTLYSAALDEKLRIKVTASTLRTIDKVGGLDQYLLKSSLDPVLGKLGQKLKEQVIQARAAKENEQAIKAVQDSMPKNASELFNFNKPKAASQ
ncbi:hypothetical protein P389DRAFT_39040 [Cystobasidium minutum MCA 4210]|uniref:mitochondrial 54S ribosomal protein bL28m n=1 Tax=Cystobasidium minutum MCA 4210 TaxID=1397322 RepID=UPI0034CDD804|eukprot:jgi/Rhomi1/39040/CE39039_1451